MTELYILYPFRGAVESTPIAIVYMTFDDLNLIELLSRMLVDYVRENVLWNYLRKELMLWGTP